MKIPTKLLLRLGLSYGIMQREAFEEQLTNMLKDKFENPEKLEKLYDLFFSQMGELKNYLTVEEIMNKTTEQENTDLKEELASLKEVLGELMKKVDNIQKSPGE